VSHKSKVKNDLKIIQAAGYQIAENLYNRVEKYRDDPQCHDERIFLEKTASQIQAYLWAIDMMIDKIDILDNKTTNTDRILDSLRAIIFKP
jgi:hypothetical protein